MTNNKILPPQTIGILGGGQLGRMMAIAAKEMGFKIAVLEPNEDSPCGQLADWEIISAYDSLQGVVELAEKSDVVTYEFENVDYKTSSMLESRGILPQGSELLKVTQDRQVEKETLSKIGVNIAQNKIVQNELELKDALETIGYPSVLKTCRGGYDGKGQAVLKSPQDIEPAKALFKNNTTCVIEKWVNYTKEISVIVARNQSGEVSTFPVGENIHKENILYQTIVPARISSELKRKAKEVAVQIAKGLELIGTLAVEMFVTDDGDILVNELAPRPHNSGHYTIEACETSQFGQHIRAVCNWSLGSTELLKAAVMVNLLGEDAVNILELAPSHPELHLHLYGKAEVKNKRKMGHFTVLGNTAEEALQKAEKIIEELVEIDSSKLEVIK